MEQKCKNPSVFSKNYWCDAARQLKSVKMLCIAALFVALRIALKELSLPVGENLTIYFAYLVNALGAMIYGPVVALLGAAVSDTVAALLFPTGAYFFPFIFVEMSSSLIFALFLWRRELSATRTILSKFSVTLFSNILLNPLVMIWYYKFLNNGKSYSFITLPRLLKNLALLPLEATLLTVFLGAMTGALSAAGIKDMSVKKIKFEKKHILLICILCVVSALAVVAYYELYLKNK